MRYGGVPLTATGLDDLVYTPSDTRLSEAYTSTPGWSTSPLFRAVNQLSVNTESEALVLPITAAQDPWSEAYDTLLDGHATYGTPVAGTSLMGGFGIGMLSGTT